jgi:hypothetical protein
MDSIFQNALVRTLHQESDNVTILNCKISNTAEDDTTAVYVTMDSLDNDGPRRRYGPVEWRPGIDGSGSPRFPVRGQKGILLVTTENDAWLMF